jgi:hypothetical protein
MRKLIRWLSGLAVVLAGVWLWNVHDWEPASTLLGTLIAFAATFKREKKSGTGGAQRQTVESGIGIQAGRDVNVRDIERH